MNLLKFKIFSLVSLFVLMMGLVMSSSASVGALDPLGVACEGAAAGSPVCNADASDPIAGEDGLLLRAANIIAIITAAVSVIVIIIAGLTTTLSAGNSSRVQQSRDAIIYAAVALGVAALAKTIVVFITGSISVGT